MVIIHSIGSLLSYGAFLIAFASGVLFLLQERQLKRKTLGRLFHRLPSLEALDRANFTSIAVGFWALTVGLVFGIVGQRLLAGTWWGIGPKELMTLMLWLSYLGLWVVRLRSTLRGHRIALLSVFGFLLVFFTLLEAHWVSAAAPARRGTSSAAEMVPPRSAALPRA